MPVDFSQQFSRINGPDDSKDKKKLLKQLHKNFPDTAVSFIDSPAVHVKKTRVTPSAVDWENRNEWRATREPGKVKETRKDIKKGKEKPVVMVERPGKDSLMIMDGHHHSEAYTQLIGQGKMPDRAKDFPAYVIKVNREKGPWDEAHNRQIDKGKI